MTTAASSGTAFASVDAAANDPPAPQASGPRPDVLAYPAPTTCRFLVFVVALLAAGAFIGGSLFNDLYGVHWSRTLERCEQSALRLTASLPAEAATLEHQAAVEACDAPAEHRRAAFFFGGAGAAGLAALLAMLAAPRVLERRRGLRAPGPRLAPAVDRVGALAGELGLRRAPTVRVGSSRLHDSFAYGTPGRYRVALAPALAIRWRDASIFDPLIRHELAHVRHRDVALAWLARCTWYALGPLLALPIVYAAVRGDASILVDYAWRAALLALIVQLISAQLLRSREHDADIRAGQSTGGPQAIARVVAMTPRSGVGPRYRALFAKHPDRDTRLAVLDRPGLIVRVTFADAFTAAFLAALTIPLIQAGAVSLLTGTSLTSATATMFAVWVAGPLLGGSVGLGLCRAALVARVSGERLRPGWPAAGVAAGLVLGQIASLGQTGAGGAAFGPLAWELATALLGAGATAIAAGLAELLAGAAPRFRSARRSSALAVVLMTALFTATLWITTTFHAVMARGATYTLLTLTSGLASWVVLAALGLTAGAAGWALLRARPTDAAPPWIVDGRGSGGWPTRARADPAEALACGVATGLVFVVALVGYGIVKGPALYDPPGAYVFMFCWAAALAAAAAFLPLALLRGRAGAGSGLAAGAVACLTTIVGWLAWRMIVDGSLPSGWWRTAVEPPLALGLVALLVVAPASLLAGHERRRRRIWPAALAISVAVATIAVSEHSTLYPADIGATAFLADRGPEAALSGAIEAKLYVATVADPIETADAALAPERAAIAARPDEGATIIVSTVLPVARAMLRTALGYDAPNSGLRSLNLIAVTALRNLVAAYAWFAVYYASNDRRAGDNAMKASALFQAQNKSWMAGVARLSAAKP